MNSKSHSPQATAPARQNRNRARSINARIPVALAACSNPVVAAAVRKARTKVRAAAVVAAKNSISGPANAVVVAVAVVAAVAMPATVAMAMAAAVAMAMAAAVLRRNHSNPTTQHAHCAVPARRLFFCFIFPL